MKNSNVKPTKKVVKKVATKKATATKKVAKVSTPKVVKAVKEKAKAANVVKPTVSKNPQTGEY